MAVKAEQQQQQQSADRDTLPSTGGSAVKQEAGKGETDSVERGALRATLNGSGMRRRRDAGDADDAAMSSEKTAAADMEPSRPLPPRLLLRASSRGPVHSFTAPQSVAASPPAVQSPSSSSAPSPSSTSAPPGFSRIISRNSTRNLFASLSKSVALFSSGHSHGQAAEDEENREWLMRRLSKDDSLDQSSSTSPSSSTTLTETNASWLLSYSHVFTFCRERVFPSLLVLLVLIQLIVLPLRLALSLEIYNWRLYDQLLDVLYVLGVLFTDYLEVAHVTDGKLNSVDGDSSGVSESRLSVRLRSSLSRRMFVFDILSTVPYYLFLPSASLSSLFAVQAHATPTRLDSLLRLPRILRTPRLSSFLDQLELFNLVQSIISPAIFRLLSFGVWMFLFAHFAGCAWWLASYVEGLPDNEWVVQAAMREGSFSKLYLHLLFVGFKCVRSTTDTLLRYVQCAAPACTPDYFSRHSLCFAPVVLWCVDDRRRS